MRVLTLHMYFDCDLFENSQFPIERTSHSKPDIRNIVHCIKQH